MPAKSDSHHRLILAELRLALVAAHRMILLVAPDGRVVRQFNGLATGAEGPIPIGWLPQHKLLAYDTDCKPSYWLCPVGARWQTAADGVINLRGNKRAHLVLDDPADGSPACLAATLMSGSPEQLASILAVLAEACAAINQRALRYPVLGFGANSNAVCTTLLHAAGLETPKIPFGAPIVPGWGRLLLDEAVLARLQLKARQARAGQAD